MVAHKPTLGMNIFRKVQRPRTRMTYLAHNALSTNIPDHPSTITTHTPPPIRDLERFLSTFMEADRMT